jgi:predicted DNA-binding ribbon-helix-helix protein
MRTTLTVDDHLAKELKEIAHRTNKPFKQVVNETLRKGLHPPHARTDSKPFRLPSVSLGGVRAGVDLDKALSVADAIEDEEIARKLELRK